jgi:hypothetical protein
MKENSKKDFLDEIIEERTKKNKEFPNMVDKAVNKQRNENPDCTDYDDEGRCNQCGQFDCYECQWGDNDEAYKSIPELTKEDIDEIWYRDTADKERQREEGYYWIKYRDDADPIIGKYSCVGGWVWYLCGRDCWVDKKDVVEVLSERIMPPL